MAQSDYKKPKDLIRSVRTNDMLEHQTSAEILFTSLATTVLDKISVAGRVVAENNPGGSALFSALGARLFALPGAEHLSPVALKINAGEDFPAEVEDLLRGWNIVLDLQRYASTLSLRAEVAYHDASLESRDFKYTTNIIPFRPLDLQGTQMLGARIFHLFTVPQGLHEQVLSLEKLRRAAGLDMPLVIWEPRSRSYVPENLQHAYDAARLADVISPNHIELLELFGHPTTVAFDPICIETLAQRLVDSGIGRDANGVIVVRSAEHGALVLSRSIPATWVPAYWRRQCQSATTSSLQVTPPDDKPAKHPQVVDTTGAGNCFLGGFAIGLLATDHDPVAAAHFGAVASSFVVQQLGLPRLDSEAKPVELWNGESVLARLERQFTSDSQADTESNGNGDGNGQAGSVAAAARLEWLRRIVAEKLPGLSA